MQLSDLKNSNAVVVGLGLTGQACARFLVEQGAKVTAMDRSADVGVLTGVTLLSGDFDADVLCAADLVILSPGVNPLLPAIQAALQSGTKVMGDVELFAQFNTLPVIAITGSNGKSTVTCLVTEILNQGGIKAQMGGNIGTPVLELLESDAEVLVLELSSFQLETLDSLKPECATILNVCEDHLDRHIVLNAYIAAKQRVYQHASICVANRDDVQTWPKDYQPKYSFGLSQSPVGLSWDESNRCILDDGEPLVYEQECGIQGLHNVLNMQAAICCVKSFNIAKDAIRTALHNFKGLAHRFELINSTDKVRWINDSKATNIGATIAAIESLKDRQGGKLILIAGGDGKNANFTELQPILLEAVDLLITLGKDGQEIASLKPGSIEVNTLQEAVEFAHNIVESGDIVLLSPACASLDMFDNYQHRGDVFKRAVQQVVS
ncbi:UDP-N-acetylmuramoyl-L-alanine--D-glutamate ligase [Aliiglaciecola litoralis]|uniref:UDP-N-acetylmuramoylalanine--D-glutamate ligase n=1 Tax=Aliiglaciecola litoralis TaxID=582857 RepID=A0ABN1LG11_9ALTE